jgi:hypothetical protein
MPGSDPPTFSFPTRQYVYRSESASRAAGVAAAPSPELALQPGQVYRFVLGRDLEPQPMTPASVRTTLHDPFAQLVLGRGGAPLSLRAVLAALDAANAEPGGVPEQRSFVVADGGQIPWTEATAPLNRQFRLAIVRGRAGETPSLFVSTSTAVDSEETFLQVIGWDPDAGAYQFYDRRKAAWIWAGSSWDALVPDSGGKGPFDSHVNGALNMKELKAPWINWHSQAASIPDSTLPPGDPLRNERIWRERAGGEEFERDVARPGVRRWTLARLSRCTRNGRLTRLPEFIRHLLTTTTVNLIASGTESRQVRPGVPLRLPLTFFVNSDALLGILGLDPGIPALTVDGGVYLECLRRFDVAITDGTFRFPGDTHFAFVVPEAAFEDVLFVQELIDARVLTEKLAAALLMVDFSNPVFSPRRAALLPHVPAEARLDGADFVNAFVASVTTAATTGPADSPEREFLALWDLADDAWRRTMEATIERFFTALAPRFATADAFAPVFELAESRRREFRRRKLAEFRLTTPITNIPESAPPLELTPTGDIRRKV